MAARWTLRLGIIRALGDATPDPAAGVSAHLTQSFPGNVRQSLCDFTAPDEPTWWKLWEPGHGMCQHCLAAMANGKNL